MLALDMCCKTYRMGSFGRGELQAVRNVSFEVGHGEVVSLIGESGSGKTTIGRMILRLTPVTAGSIAYDGTDIATFGRGLKGYYRMCRACSRTRSARTTRSSKRIESSAW